MKQKYISEKIVEENGEINIPYEEVVFEEQEKVTGGVKVTYTFTDYSSITILYTKDKDYILKRMRGVPTLGMRE